MSTTESPGTCPVHEFNHYAEMPFGEKIKFYDSLRDEAPLIRNNFANGHYIVTRYEEIMAVYQDAKTFSNSAVTVFNPEPTYRWIPEMLDGDEHRQWRKQLGPHFSPKAVEVLEDKVRSRAVELIKSIAARGSCDFMQDFANQYPSFIFLELMGLPFEDLDKFLHWEDEILHVSAGTAEETARRREVATIAVTDYFDTIIAQRRIDPKDDLVSKALTFVIDGKPVNDDDLRAFCLLMFMAGLDTVSATLGITFLHLATHQDDRQSLVDDPDMIPVAIEEMLRAHAIVLPSRKVMEDTEIAGCPIKAGEMISVPLNLATRDDSVYDDAKDVILDRHPNNHIAFGAGPHRCLGSHLARRELKIALEEWHKLIPNYRLSDRSNPKEAGAQLGPSGDMFLEWEV
ncbi:MAG: cytochrome P450 [Gordonia sp.]|nr:cytochrome P450 [Gordonia sp. (in: high G+C Gram-positive bacteria)]